MSITTKTLPFHYLSVRYYKSTMGDSIKTKSFKEGTYRHHINKETFREGKKDFNKFLNKFKKLE